MNAFERRFVPKTTNHLPNAMWKKLFKATPSHLVLALVYEKYGFSKLSSRINWKVTQLPCSHYKQPNKEYQPLIVPMAKGQLPCTSTKCCVKMKWANLTWFYGAIYCLDAATSKEINTETMCQSLHTLHANDTVHLKMWTQSPCGWCAVSAAPQSFVNYKGAVHILGKICPRSDPDIAHMEYSMDPLKFISRGKWF